MSPEIEEELELQPGLSMLANQILRQIVELGQGKPAYAISSQKEHHLIDKSLLAAGPGGAGGEITARTLRRFSAAGAFEKPRTIKGASDGLFSAAANRDRNGLSGKASFHPRRRKFRRRKLWLFCLHYFRRYIARPAAVSPVCVKSASVFCLHRQTPRSLTGRICRCHRISNLLFGKKIHRQKISVICSPSVRSVFSLLQYGNVTEGTTGHPAFPGQPCFLGHAGLCQSAKRNADGNAIIHAASGGAPRRAARYPGSSIRPLP